jgi:hypothetical protein
MKALNPNGHRLLALGLLCTVLLVGGCGADEEDTETAASTGPAATETAPTPVSPATTATEPKPTKTPKPAAEAPSAPSSGCSTPDTISNLKFSGVACEQGTPIVVAWDRNPNDCNTIDNPDSPEGYKRTCEIEGYTCLAKRDVKSENRNVACSKGPASIRFTWTP